MNNRQREDWIFESLKQILNALAENSLLRASLIFKGAFILNFLLPTARKSLDIDSNLTSAFTSDLPSPEQRILFLKTNVAQAITLHFERQNPVRYELIHLQVNPHPLHPRGWDGFDLKINLSDNYFIGVRGLPAIHIDISAAEPLSRYSIKEIALDSSSILAYSLERIAGEKARAFLSSLPAHRTKIRGFEKTARVKDLYDLGRIYRNKSMKDNTFWRIAGEEFKLACKARFVDCLGSASFQEDWVTTKTSYEKNPTIPKDMPFADVEKTVLTILEYWQDIGIIPFEFPLPST
jgi:hypothetical protein